MIRPKLADERSVFGLPQLTWFQTLKKSAWIWTLTSSLIPNCLRSEMSQTWYDGPVNWPRSLLPRRPSGAEANAARFEPLDRAGRGVDQLGSVRVAAV